MKHQILLLLMKTIIKIMKKIEWNQAKSIIIVLLIIMCYLLIISCENELVEYPPEEDECCTQAYITVNNDYPNQNNNYYYQGDWTTWFTLKQWNDGESFIVVLEDCTTESYIGKFIIIMVD